MLFFILFLRWSFGARLYGLEKIDRELYKYSKTQILSEAALNQLVDLDLYQGDIVLNEDKPKSRNIKKDLTKRWPE